MSLHMKDDFMWHLFHQQRWKSHEHNISWLFYSLLRKLLFYFKYIHFWQHSGQYLWNKFISLDYIKFHCKSTVNLAGLFDYFQHGEVFLLARDGVQYPRIFPIHSRINPFYSRNFTFITQEITNTLLKKFEGPYSSPTIDDGLWP